MYTLLFLMDYRNLADNMSLRVKSDEESGYGRISARKTVLLTLDISRMMVIWLTKITLAMSFCKMPKKTN